jgi:hypothetical protein
MTAARYAASASDHHGRGRDQHRPAPRRRRACRDHGRDDDDRVDRAVRGAERRRDQPSLLERGQRREQRRKQRRRAEAAADLRKPARARRSRPGDPVTGSVIGHVRQGVTVNVECANTRLVPAAGGEGGKSIAPALDVIAVTPPVAIVPATNWSAWLQPGRCDRSGIVYEGIAPAAPGETHVVHVMVQAEPPHPAAGGVCARVHVYPTAPAYPGQVDMNLGYGIVAALVVVVAPSGVGAAVIGTFAGVVVAVVTVTAWFLTNSTVARWS